MGEIDRVEETILKRIEESFGEQLEFLKELISIPSLPGTKAEGQAQKIFRKKLKEIDEIEIDEWEPSLSEVNGYPFHPIREERENWNYDGRPIVVGKLKGSRKNSLILNGHIDVVSAEPSSAWSKHPWNAQIDDGKLYGRGANDMKAGLASIVYALKSLVECNLRPQSSVIVESVVEEEFGGGGTIATLLRGYSASAALVAEPSGTSNICTGSGGSRFFRVQVLGRSGAPQSYHFGVDSIELGYKLYSVLMKLNSDRQKSLKGKHPSFERKGEGVMFGDGRATNLTVGKFRAGDFPATVPGWTEMEGRIGFPVGETGEAVRAELTRTVLQASKEHSWLKEHLPKVKWFNAQREPYELTPDEPLVKVLRKCVENVTGSRPTLFSTPSSSDAVFFAKNVGKLGGIPVVTYGPGGLNAHGADEFVYVEEIVRATKAIALLIKRWCGIREG